VRSKVESGDVGYVRLTQFNEQTYDLVQGQALDLILVDLGDDVVGEQAGLGGGRVVDRRDDLDPRSRSTSR
jgi:hypothetical protein